MYKPKRASERRELRTTSFYYVESHSLEDLMQNSNLNQHADNFLRVECNVMIGFKNLLDSRTIELPFNNFGKNHIGERAGDIVIVITSQATR